MPRALSNWSIHSTISVVTLRVTLLASFVLAFCVLLSGHHSQRDRPSRNVCQVSMEGVLW